LQHETTKALQINVKGYGDEKNKKFENLLQRGAFQIIACMEDVQKSRRDNTLLTVCFILRTEHTPPLQNPAGMTFAPASC
jgi:hypothetical protein